MDQAYNIAGKDERERPNHELRLCDMASDSVYAPSDDIRVLGPVAIAQWQPFPAKYGYRVEVITIFDVIAADRRYPGRRDFSGVSGGYLSASRNSLGT